MNRQRNNPGDILKQLPTKWAVALVAALIGYAFLQPVANRKLGLSLPSLATLTGKAAPADSPTKPTADREGTQQKTGGSESQKKAGESAGQGGAAADQREDSQTQVGSSRTRGSSESSEANSSRGSPDESLKYGLLREVGRERYLSPSGLLYTSGSEEGHRLKHVAKHLEDQPKRPGSHGVFYGDMPQVLRWIDQAYDRGNDGGKGAKKRQERGRWVYEVSFDKPIGYVGGSNGKRKGNPEARSIRLVIEDNRVITAFPY